MSVCFFKKRSFIKINLHHKTKQTQRNNCFSAQRPATLPALLPFYREDPTGRQ